MKFDSYVQELEKMNREKLRRNEEYDRKMAAFRAQAEEVNRSNVEKEIADMVSKVNYLTGEKLRYLIKAEQMLYPGRNIISTCVHSVKPHYVEADFANEFQKNYHVFEQALKEIKSFEFDAAATMAINALAESYAVINDVAQKITSLLARYVGENALKKQRLAEIEAETYEFESNFDQAEMLDAVAAKQNMNELKKMLDEFAKDCDEVGGIPTEPELPEDFSRAELVLGLSCTEQRTVNLDAYKTQIVLPQVSNVLSVGVTSGQHTLVTYPAKNADDDKLWNNLRCIVMRFLMCYPGRHKQVVALYENTFEGKMGNLMSEVEACCEDNAFIFPTLKRVATSKEDMRKSLEALAVEIDRRNKMLYGSYKDVLAYNVANPDNPLPIILCVVKDVNLGGAYGFAKDFGNIARNCKEAGIYFIALNKQENWQSNWDALVDADENNDKIFANFLQYDPASAMLKEDKFSVDCTRNSHLLDNHYFDQIKQQTKQVSVLDFVKFHSEQDGKLNKDNVQTLLTFPLGRQGSAPVYVGLDSSSPLAHMTIEGMNGSGKTSLLQSIILAAAYHYSPEELEIWIFDFMRGGQDFDAYKKLKHVKYMAIDCDPMDSLEMMEHIENELSNRGPIAGTKNPRTMIVIDEYQRLNRIGLQKLEMLAKQIRKQGASLVLCTQSAQGFEQINNQISHRLVMYKNETDRYYLIPDANERGVLTAKNRMVMYAAGSERNNRYVMKFAYAGKEKELDNTIRLINERYPESPAAAPVIMGETRAPSLKNKKIYPNASSDVVRVYLGEKNLTSKPIEYKVDRNNRFLYLFGDRNRASGVESLFAETFTQLNKKPSVYYVNLVNYEDNAMRNYAEQNPDYATKNPLDAERIIKQLYKLHEDRYKFAVLNGGKIEEPIEVVIHCAGRMEQILQSISQTSAPAAQAGVDNDDCANKDNAELLSMLETNSAPTFVVKQKEKSCEEMMREVLKSMDETKIYFVIHFDNVEEMENSRIFPRDVHVVKDCIITPAIPDVNEVSFAEIINTLRRLGLSEHAEYYQKKQESCKNDLDREKARLSFRQFILIDEKQPYVYLPFEQEE